ncbi:MAG: Hsp20/alpha crystallin family protein [Thaumarchaeota archaeon]|nr:Hsp20/alpha crystallin family protein [Nitrososphaerota archaeon]
MITWLPRLRPDRFSQGRSAGRTSASTSTTWKGQGTSSSSEPDSLEEELAELVRAAQEDMDGLRSKEADGGELIEGPDAVTFVLMAPGYSGRDFRATAEADRLKVEAYDLKIERPLGCTVVPSSARSTYINGVLSVRVDKKL